MANLKSLGKSKGFANCSKKAPLLLIADDCPHLFSQDGPLYSWSPMFWIQPNKDNYCYLIIQAKRSGDQWSISQVLCLCFKIVIHDRRTSIRLSTGAQ